MTCPKGKVNEAGLCYTPCDPGFKGILNYCWPGCPEGWTDYGVGCTKPTYGRGAGTIPKNCPDGQENDAALCYPKCSENFYGVGPVCWGSCPAGFRDDGAFCAKPSSYGRGAGHWSEQNCINSGDHGAKENGCEQYGGSGGLWYPKCDKNFHSFGCCVCSPNCPAGFTDIGISCAKATYGRGVGKIPEVCDDGKENNSGLCYVPCRENFKGVGPICWGICPTNSFTDSGALCTKLAINRGVGTIPNYGIGGTILKFLGIIILIIMVIGILYAVIKKKTAG